MFEELSISYSCWLYDLCIVIVFLAWANLKSSDRIQHTRSATAPPPPSFSSLWAKQRKMTKLSGMCVHKPPKLCHFFVPRNGSFFMWKLCLIIKVFKEFHHPALSLSLCPLDGKKFKWQKRSCKKTQVVPRITIQEHFRITAVQLLVTIKFMFHSFKFPKSYSNKST